MTKTNLVRIMLMVLALAWLDAQSAAAESEPFDHFRMRFPLVGAHERVDCESCHVNGIFRGTPVQCRFCHDGTGLRATTARSSRHVSDTGVDCDSCHRTTRWAAARMDHAAVSDRCQQCHNGISASGKPARHIPSTDNCGDCHRSSTWGHARFDHDNIQGACTTCHNGTIAEGKNQSHIATTSDCDLCHSTRRWSPSRFDHAEVTGACMSCHDGVTATGKDNGHVTTSSDCDVCHSNTRWVPANFDHAEVTGACMSCHNGVEATGPDNGHFVTVLDCDSCHSNTRWTNADYDHIGTSYPGDHRQNLNCTECHGGNSDPVTWDAPQYQPDCAGCHERDFDRDDHKQHENPDHDYTVGELRDCGGSCHVYTNSSLTTIKDRRDREHRVSDGDFD